VAEAMEQGAFGLSSGLIYAPGAYATTDEVVGLASEAARYGGLYATHMRDEADGLFGALDEALEIGRRAGLPVQVSHLKAAGFRQHGRIGEAVARIEAARAAGVAAAADFYPYEAGSTGLSALLPPWLLEGGVDRLVERLSSAEVRRRVQAEIENGLPGWWNPVGAMGGDWRTVLVTRVATEENRPMQGRRLGDVAAERGQAAIDTVADLLVAERGSVQIVIFMMDPADVAEVARTPWVSMGTDGSAVSPKVAQRQLVHPRTYGTTARFLSGYAGRRGGPSWPEAVARMTSVPAARLGLKDRGRVAAGMKADLVVLDPASLEDRATYAEPHVAPAGVELVTVNGTVAVRDGRVTGKRDGRVLRRG
jgi:N-acyl-D-amino-acid deacylase